MYRLLIATRSPLEQDRWLSAIDTVEDWSASTLTPWTRQATRAALLGVGTAIADTPMLEVLQQQARWESHVIVAAESLFAIPPGAHRQLLAQCPESVVVEWRADASPSQAYYRPVRNKPLPLDPSAALEVLRGLVEDVR